MANPEHIKWLKEGVESWNRKRQKEFFVPDLSFVDVYKEFGKEKDYKSSNSLSLRGIDLSSADLQESDLSTSDLRGADLSYSNLEGANLSHTLLEDANLDSISLSMETKLYRSNLIGADLAGVDLLSAQIFPPPCTASPQYIPPAHKYEQLPDTVGNIHSLTYMCKKLQEHYEDFPCEQTQLYFRGERNDSWDLSPSVIRESGKKEGEMLSDLLSRCPEEFNGMTTALSQWMFAQHYGLKTRLLDVTLNPLVGLFYASEANDVQDGSHKDGLLHIFAVPKSFMLDVYPFELIKPFNSDTVRVIMNFAKLSQYEKHLLLGKEGTSRMPHDPRVPKYGTAMNRLYHFIRQEYPSFEKQIDVKDLFCVFVVEPQRSFERIRAQQGAFLISAFHERFEEEEILRHSEQIPCYHHYKVRIPHNNKQAIREDLCLLNITQETLFPGLKETIQAINRLHGHG